MSAENPNQTDTQTRDSQGPINRVKQDKVSASIWEQQNADGRTFYNFTLSKRYHDKETGEARYSTKFSRSDLAELPLLVPRVDERMRELMEAQRVQTHAQDAEQNQTAATGLQAQRDAALNNVPPKPSPSQSNGQAQKNTPGHAQTPQI